MKYIYDNEMFNTKDKAIEVAVSQIDDEELFEALHDYISLFGFWTFWNRLSEDLVEDIYRIAQDMKISTIRKVYESEDEEEE